MTNTEMAVTLYSEIIRNWSHDDYNQIDGFVKARSFAKIVAESVAHKDVLSLLDAVDKQGSERCDYWNVVFLGLTLRDGNPVEYACEHS